MSNFWQSSSGTSITGNATEAFTPDFDVIPNNTTALAQIKLFDAVHQAANEYAPEMDYYEITWKITDGDYKNRQIQQKIKVFTGKPEQMDRAKNMMKLIMDLCGFKPTHSAAPSAHDLLPMHGKILGIKVREWAMPKSDGSGMVNGNFVSEVHPAHGFECLTGIKMKVKDSVGDSALTRNSRAAIEKLDNDLPF